MTIETRKTVRLLILDSQRRVLLLKYHDPSVPGRDPEFWATPGGKVEDGETLESAAMREASEETGHIVRLGPEVWYGEHILPIGGVPLLLQERFVLAHLDAEAFSSDAWTMNEREVLRELRWWRLDELENTRELVFPAVMKGLLPRIMAGGYPERPQRIQL